MPKIALIDGDVVAYRCAASTCRNWYYVDGKEFKYKKDAHSYIEEYLEIPRWRYEGVHGKKVKQDNHKGLIESEQVIEGDGITRHNVDQMMQRILGDTGVEDYEVWLTGDGNYRYELAVTQPYKGNRDSSKIPPNLTMVREYIRHDYGGQVVNGIEADDMLGIVQSASKPLSTVIASVDKDLRMIAGYHYNIATSEMDLVEQHEADRNFYLQLLIGDRVDNIKGVDGVGDITAKKLLPEKASLTDWYEICLDTYRKAYGDDGEARLVEAASLLWIQREEGVLWTPPVDG